MKPTVNFLRLDPNLASVRLRGVLPAQELSRRGWDINSAMPDVLIAAKHGYSFMDLPKARSVIFDICDDHFDDSLADHYLDMCHVANVVTVNTPSMRFIVSSHINALRDPFLIPDPNEQERIAPTSDFNHPLLWFGHFSNYQDLERLIRYNQELRTEPMLVVTNSDREESGWRKWSYRTMQQSLHEAGLVIIPTGKGIAKSPNRLMTAVMAGKFVCAEPLPAYEEFSDWMWIGDITKGIKWCRDNPEKATKAIIECQDYIEEKYNIKKITDRWEEAILMAYELNGTR